MVSCRYCQKKINPDDAIELFDRHYVCSDACRIAYEQTDMYDKDKLLDIAWNLCGKTGDFIRLKSQAEYYHSEYKYKYSGMLYTINYWSNIEGNSWNDAYGLGQIFPQYYEKALKYWHNQQELKKKCRTASSEEIKPKTVTVGVNIANRRANRFKINIEDL
ncbi:MAG: hypothetical protein KBT06_10660 [Prevotellaceae bacterium]|nr:hypothetical protein [Candidatus Colivivens equi]